MARNKMPACDRIGLGLLSFTRRVRRIAARTKAAAGRRVDRNKRRSRNGTEFVVALIVKAND